MTREAVAEECAKLCDAQAAVYEKHIRTRTGERLTRAENYFEAATWLAEKIRFKFGLSVRASYKAKIKGEKT